MQKPFPVMTAKIQKKDIRGLGGLQLRSIIRDSRSRGARRTCLNQPRLQQTPPRLVFPNHPENYVAPFSIRWNIFIPQHQKIKKESVEVEIKKIKKEIFIRWVPPLSMLRPKKSMIRHKSHPRPVLSGQLTVRTVGSPSFCGWLMITTSS